MIHPEDYAEFDLQEFVEDMQFAGYEVQHYHGRWFWEGPSVIAETVEEIRDITDIPIQWDNMGLDYVVYPVEKGKLLEDGTTL